MIIAEQSIAEKNIVNYSGRETWYPFLKRVERRTL